jgi:hypothetical protein
MAAARNAPAKAAAKAPYVAVVEPVIVIKPFLEDNFVPDVVAHVDALIAEIEHEETAEPVVDEVIVAEPTVVVEDADLAALLAAIGHDAA